MRRFAVAVVLLALFSGAVACGGGTFFISASNEGVTFFTVSGTVSIVQLTIINGGQFTVVTLLNMGTAQTFTFCGNVVAQFPMNTPVKVDFKRNGSCDIVLQVT